MTSPSAERSLSAKLLNKSLHQRLCDVDAMLDAITDYAIVQLDVNGSVVRWCPGAEALLGYSAVEVLDRPVSMFYTAEDRAAGVAERELATADGSGRVEFEGWRIRKNGELFRAGVVLSPIQDEAGVITAFASVIRDLTAEHQRAENMFHDLLESAPDAMVIIAPDGRILLANAQTDHMFGYRRQDLIGRSVEILVPTPLRGAHEHHRTGFIDEPEPRRMGAGLNLWGLRSDGTTFPVDVSLSPLRTDQGVLVSAAIRDITEHLAVQSELADVQAQAEVSAERDRIASELQDHALQRVFAVGLALQATVPRAGSAEVQQRLNEAIDDLHAVVQDFRTAIFDLRRSHADIAGLQQRFDDLIGQLSRDLATTVQYKGPLSVVETALADHAEAVLKEAIINAVRHAEATRLVIVVDVADELCIDVSDNGKGIPDELTEGGLVNLRQRALALGGSLTIGDSPGGGARLRWAVPLS